MEGFKRCVMLKEWHRGWKWWLPLGKRAVGIDRGIIIYFSSWLWSKSLLERKSPSYISTLISPGILASCLEGIIRNWKPRPWESSSSNACAWVSIQIKRDSVLISLTLPSPRSNQGMKKNRVKGISVQCREDHISATVFYSAFSLHDMSIFPLSLKNFNPYYNISSYG